ncbi:Gfo/Idh/MocA family protein [Myroides odoratimimus]|uniref:Gfo/Idh/MocA family protein n=1 Tax=Myroides odoratimimus TaxID=76832 RepID=UPI002576E5EC|nr:Gfo/Idh/MocA family oxidoreductase [Myroides odoratimimus]MDM1086228.1 Gfo/Idh/MocA family oxidoreductase [Myroides odoratimimus]
MKVLVIGLGSIAKKHLQALYEIDNTCDIYALRSSNRAVNLEGIKNLYSLEECKNIQFDFVIISNPTSEHYATIEKVRSFNIPLFIEKPLFANINVDSEELVRDIIKNNISTYVACNLRFLESLVFLKNNISDTRINEVNVYCGSYLPDWRPDVDYRTVYSANAEMGGGVHIDLIHELDYVFWFFGEPESTISNFSNKSSLSISANDYANYLWKYDKFNVSIILNYYRRKPKREFEIVTDEFVYKVNLLTNTVYKDDEVIFEHSNRISNTYLNQMSFFIEHIVKGKEVMNDINEANKILKICMQE